MEESALRNSKGNRAETLVSRAMEAAVGLPFDSEAALERDTCYKAYENRIGPHSAFSVVSTFKYELRHPGASPGLTFVGFL